MRWQRFWAIFKARNMEFVRDRMALGWNFAFPLFIVIGFAFAFSGAPPDRYKVGLYGGAIEAWSSQIPFLKTDYIQFIQVTDQQAAKLKVERHQLDMLLDLKQQKFWINDTSPNGYLLERVLHGSNGGGQVFHKATVSGREVRYVDWVFPGVMGMNMMFSALFGIGYVIVRYRKNGVLKRLKATPITAFEFLAAQVVSRLWLIVVVATIIYVGTDLFLNFTMHGHYLDLLLIFMLGSLSMISMSLLIAARVRSEELAGGLLNLLSWPMVFLSGVWFSIEGIHPVLQKLALCFPLTHMIDGARAVMIDGSGLAEISTQLIVLLLMSLVFLFIGALSFRWE